VTSPPQPPTVWYASYGSNLCAERFACYIRGGSPPGAGHTHAGARDTRLPRATLPLEVPYRLYFSGDSGWGGAPAFLDTKRTTSARTFARAYLITWEQFEDVVAQENVRASSPIAIGRLIEGDSTQIGPGRYENLLCVGSREDVPIVTFTAPWALSDASPGEPSLRYLAMLIAGLRESHGLDDGTIVRYLGAAPGCTPGHARDALALQG
jgi:hypothetical protein